MVRGAWRKKDGFTIVCMKYAEDKFSFNVHPKSCPAMQTHSPPNFPLIGKTTTIDPLDVDFKL